MRILSALLILPLLSPVLCAEGRAKPKRLPLGKKAPLADVTMKGVDGKRYSIASVRGKKGTLVVFSCNHCPVVKKYEERMARILNAWRKKGVGVLVINANDPRAYPEDRFEEMVKRAKKRGFEFPYVVDETSQVARAFGATKTPECFLFDAEGKLVYWGAIDDSPDDPEAVEEPYLENALRALVAGEKIPRAEARAVGCSIKYRPPKKATTNPKEAPKRREF